MKKNGKLRPLGIPTIKDRVYQNIVRNALEPQWEARFEAISYGFRPKRSTHDAIRSIFNRINRGTKKKWIFEGDFQGCFDHLNHEWILKQTSYFPGRKLLKRWLKMGYMEQSFFAETQEGTPQGGIISPLLANIALHGMEETLGITYKKNYKANDSYIMNPACKFTLIRYADDFVVLTETKEQALSVYMRLRPYLKDRGLELSPEKTKVTHIEEGFEFLGFLIRQYQTEQGNKLFIKPSKGSRQKAKKKIGDTLRVMRVNPSEKSSECLILLSEDTGNTGNMSFLRKSLVQWIAISIGESANIFDSSIQRSRGNGYMQDITGIHIMVEMLGHQPARKQISNSYICHGLRLRDTTW